jgi:uncharacterized protein with HEPN domain
MNPRDRVRLRHMLDSLGLAIKFVEGRTRSDLDSDDMLRMALVQAISVVGEAAGKITPEGRAELTELPWASVVGMRNRLVHAYFDIDRDILWTTVTEAAPPLVKRLLTLLGDE